MKIVVIEPFYTSSHKQWLDGLIQFTDFEITALTLPGRHWKWRMHGAAITIAKEYLQLDFTPDLILATDMLDFSTFLGLTKDKTANVKTAIYFHENQICYPWSPNDEDVAKQRDVHYGFINYTSALVADKVFFNSNYHKTAFLDALRAYLNNFPDAKNIETIDEITNKSEVLPIGMDFSELDKHQADKRFENPTILWNHRWEYDKNPDDFFNTLKRLQDEQIAFNLVVLGENYKNAPTIFKQVPKLFKNELLHFGFAESRSDYIKWLWKCDIVPVTSKQDFFGISAVEAIYCNNYPILPNRLAFPEHVPEEYLYNDNEALYEQLKASIENIVQTRNTNTQAFAKKYDWENLQPTYHKLLNLFNNR